MLKPNETFSISNKQITITGFEKNGVEVLQSSILYVYALL